MSADLIEKPRSLLPEPMPAPRVSGALWEAFEATSRPHPDIGPPRAYSAPVQAEARAWLLPIQAAVRNPADEDRLPGWVAAVLLAVGHLEVGAFTAGTQREALQTFKFFPSAADVYEILAGPAVEIRMRLRTLERIASAPAREEG
ncbi:MAG: hypothetical protein WDN25_13325 [Acetobacteraceae bacterium]